MISSVDHVCDAPKAPRGHSMVEPIVCRTTPTMLPLTCLHFNAQTTTGTGTAFDSKGSPSICLLTLWPTKAAGGAISGGLC